MDDYSLDLVLPADLPNREAVIQGASRHVDLIVEANKYMNLTRITTPREAAIKHVLDSVIPWRLFAKAKRVLDAGTGAGFPGIPLALVLPGTHFTMAESIQKKARFVESVLQDLQLPNAEITPRRAEELDAGFITARALRPEKEKRRPPASLQGPRRRTGNRRRRQNFVSHGNRHALRSPRRPRHQDDRSDQRVIGLKLVSCHIPVIPANSYSASPPW